MGSIIIPTSELLGGITDVLPTVLDPKSSLAGFALEWAPVEPGADTYSLRWTAYDIYAGATVEWVPFEGDESRTEEGPNGEKFDDETAWGGDADPFRIFVTLADAKEIIKLFKVPAKLWRTPVMLKVNEIGSRLIIERRDSATAERFLSVSTYNDALRHIPDVRALAVSKEYTPAEALYTLSYANSRFAALAAARPHGTMRIIPNGVNEPTQVNMGSRYHAFLYRQGAKVARFNFLRDGSGVQVS